MVLLCLNCQKTELFLFYLLHIKSPLDWFYWIMAALVYGFYILVNSSLHMLAVNHIVLNILQIMLKLNNFYSTVHY